MMGRNRKVERFPWDGLRSEWGATARGSDPGKGSRKQKGLPFGCALNVTIDRPGKIMIRYLRALLEKISGSISVNVAVARLIPTLGKFDGLLHRWDFLRYIEYSNFHGALWTRFVSVPTWCAARIELLTRPVFDIKQTCERGSERGIISCLQISSSLRSKCTGEGTRYTYARKRNTYAKRDSFLTSHSVPCTLLTKKWHRKEMLHVKLSPCLRRCRESTADFFFFFLHHTSPRSRYGSRIGPFTGDVT